MVKSTKKRSISESETIEKTVQESSNVSKALKKKKAENGAAQNGQGNKEVKTNAPKKAMNVKKATNEGSPDKNKKQVTDKNEKKLQLIKKRQEYRTQRKQEGRKLSQEISTDDLKNKIQEIEKRENLSKSAKRKLATLKKLLLVKDGTVVPKKQVAKKQVEKLSAKKKQVESTEVQKKKVPEKVEVKSTKEGKKDAKQGNLLLVKQKAEAKVKDEDDDDDDDDDDEEEEEVEGDDASEDEDESVDEEKEEEEDEDESLEEEEEDDEESEDEEEEEDEEKEVDDQAKPDNVQTQKVKEKPQQNKEQQDGKKRRYVLFVGNIPYDVTAEELEKHFLTKVSEIVSIRIPKKENSEASRGFAYVELGNNTDYEKALLLNHSFVKGRRINVQYSTSDRKESVAKNYKLQALQKAGKLAGGPNRNYQKNFGRKGGKPYMQRTKT